MERRNFSRKATDEFAFVQLDRENGGTVLNVSEGGLRFQANAPVHPNGPIYIWFWLNVGDRIEAVAERMWSDDAGKEGGLRFTRLAEDARRQIRFWLEHSTLPGTPAEVAPSPRAPAVVPPPREVESGWEAGSSPALPSLWPGDRFAVTQNNDAVPAARETPPASRKRPTLPSAEEVAAAPWPQEVSPSGREVRRASWGHDAAGLAREIAPAPWRPEEARPPRKAPSMPLSLLSATPDKPEPEHDDSAELIPMQQYQTRSRLHFFRGFFVGVLLSALAAVPVFVILMRHADGTASLPATAASSSAQNQPRDVAAPPADPPSSFSSGKSNKGIPAVRDAKIAAGPAPVFPQSRPRNPEPTSGSPAGTGIGSNLSRPIYDLRTPARAVNESQPGKMTPERLWAAVQQGNPRAEVALADLYLRGDGVPKNCDQARVLLIAAAQKHNAEAVKRLQQLNEQGCPTD